MLLAGRKSPGHGLTVKCIRATGTTPGAYGTIDISGVTGTCVPAVDAAVVPLDDTEVLVEFTTGCTLGTAGGTAASFLPFRVVSMYQGVGNGSDPTTNFNWVVVGFNFESNRALNV